MIESGIWIVGDDPYQSPGAVAGEQTARRAREARLQDEARDARLQAEARTKVQDSEDRARAMGPVLKRLNGGTPAPCVCGGEFTLEFRRLVRRNRATVTCAGCGSSHILVWEDRDWQHRAWQEAKA